ncbi:MAG TPA: hypothetical protein VL424_08285 [Pararobbsia sp.]|nr:hypothetical protein [Pararobbsia sp.]
MKPIDLNPRLRRVSPLFWVFESLEDDPGFTTKKFFMFDAAYLDGLLYLAVNVGEEPWNGLVVCTSHEQHASLIDEFPELAAHPVIGKWLYLPQTHPDFESIAHRLARLALRRDTRMGVEPGSRKRSTSIKRAQSAKKSATRTRKTS